MYLLIQIKLGEKRKEETKVRSKFKSSLINLNTNIIVVTWNINWLYTTIKGQNRVKNLCTAYKALTLSVRKQKLRELYRKGYDMQTLTKREVLQLY